MVGLPRHPRIVQAVIRHATERAPRRRHRLLRTDLEGGAVYEGKGVDGPGCRVASGRVDGPKGTFRPYQPPEPQKFSGPLDLQLQALVRRDANHVVHAALLHRLVDLGLGEGGVGAERHLFALRLLSFDSAGAPFSPLNQRL